MEKTMVGGETALIVKASPDMFEALWGGLAESIIVPRM
jgi:hypothetical protein